MKRNSSLSATYLDAEACRRVFRVLMATSAEPGTIGRLPDAVLGQPWPPALALPLCLADLETSVAVRGSHGPELACSISAATGAVSTVVGEADQVVFLDAVETGDVDALRVGTADAPEHGAKVAIAVARLQDQPGDGAASLELELSGPGVPGTRTLVVTGLRSPAVAALQRRNAAYPAGIDVWLIADDGLVAALPRTTRATPVTEDPGTPKERAVSRRGREP